MGILTNLGIKTPLSKVPLLTNTYCLSCKKDTRNIDPKVIKTKNNRKMMFQDVLFAIIKILHLFQKDLVCLIV